jgi:hypothetical protein
MAGSFPQQNIISKVQLLLRGVLQAPTLGYATRQSRTKNMLVLDWRACPPDPLEGQVLLTPQNPVSLENMASKGRGGGGGVWLSTHREVW